MAQVPCEISGSATRKCNTSIGELRELLPNERLKQVWIAKSNFDFTHPCLEIVAKCLCMFGVAKVIEGIRCDNDVGIEMPHEGGIAHNRVAHDSIAIAKIPSICARERRTRTEDVRASEISAFHAVQQRTKS